MTNYMDTSQQDSLQRFAAVKLDNSENYADQLSLLKSIFLVENPLPQFYFFQTKTTLQLRIYACSEIMNQIQREFLFLLLTNI